MFLTAAFVIVGALVVWMTFQIWKNRSSAFAESHKILSEWKNCISGPTYREADNGAIEVYLVSMSSSQISVRLAKGHPSLREARRLRPGDKVCITPNPNYTELPKAELQYAGAYLLLTKAEEKNKPQPVEVA